MKRLSYLFGAAIVGVVIISLASCQGDKTQALQTQVDSLTATTQSQAQDLAFYQECITLFTEGMDSIAKADKNLMTVVTSREQTVTRESIKQELDSYAGLLKRQRERIAALESRLSDANQQMEQLKSLLDMLNQRIIDKDVTIQDLQEKADAKDFKIAMLQDEVNRLYTENANLKDEISSQRKTINIAQGIINEAYYIVGTSKELKAANILSGKFLGKSKVDVDNIDLSLFKQVDIRKFHRLNVDGKITLKSQHPSDSYRVEYDKESKTSTLYVTDEIDFWSLTRYLIIQQ